MGMATHRNIRTDISKQYLNALERVDSTFKRWMDVSSDMQDLVDRALPYVDSVVVPYMREGGEPELILMADGVEQEAAAWRALGEFGIATGWKEIGRKQDEQREVVNVRLYHPTKNSRLCVTVRCMEV